MLLALQNGQSLKVTLPLASGGNADFTLPLKGFKPAYARIEAMLPTGMPQESVTSMLQALQRDPSLKVTLPLTSGGNADFALPLKGFKPAYARIEAMLSIR